MLWRRLVIQNGAKSISNLYSYNITVKSFLIVRFLFCLLTICYYYIICPERFQVERWALVDSVFWKPISFFQVLHLPLLSYNEILVLKFILLISLLFLSIGLFSRIAGVLIAFLGLYLFGLSGNFGQDEVREYTFIFSLLVLCLISVIYSRYNLLIFFLNRKYLDKKKIPAGPLILVQHYFIFTYAAAGWLKIKAGGSSYFTQPVIETLFISHQVDFGIFLSQFSLLCKFLGFLFIVLETTTPILFIFRRLLKFYLPALFLFHISVELTMNLYFYPWMISFLIFTVSTSKQQPPINISIKNKKMWLKLSMIILFWIFVIEGLKNRKSWPFGHMRMYLKETIVKQTYWRDGLDIVKASGTRQYIIKYKDEIFWPFDHHRILWAFTLYLSDNPKQLSKALEYLLKLTKENKPDGNFVGIVYSSRKYHLQDKYLKFPIDEEVRGVYCMENYNYICEAIIKNKK